MIVRSRCSPAQNYKHSKREIIIEYCNVNKDVTKYIFKLSTLSKNPGIFPLCNQYDHHVVIDTY